MPEQPVDLFSDTHTLPTPGMRRAIAEAEVGDEQLGEDPTTKALEERVADLCGKEAGLLLATGSMCNKVAVAALTRPGDAVVVDSRAHVMRFEGGGPAVLSGVVFEAITTERGYFEADRLRTVLNPGSVYQPRTSLVGLEQTHNFAGGTVWPLGIYRDVCETAHRHGASVFTDGARLLNAVVASGVSAREWSAPVDAMWVGFSKGLGAPGGAVLTGSKDVIDAANRFKHLLGGGMRQSGILAAGCLYALDHNVERLGDDHERADRLAAGLGDLGIAVEPPETNMVFFDPAPLGMTVAGFVAALADRGVRVSIAAGRARAVTHLGIDDRGIDRELAAAAEVAASRGSS
jgi:threonine aldolase